MVIGLKQDYKKAESFVLIGMLLSILLIGYFCSCKIEFPGSTGDELAYLSQASRYAGMGNKELMQYYAYYGQGISLIWSFVFRLFSNNPIMIYRIVIFMNSFFLAGSFLLSYYCGRILYPLWNKFLLLLACYLIILYPCNIYYMQIAETENFLWLLFWINFFSYVKIIYSHKWIYSLLYAISISLMLITHYRTIVILLASCVLFLFLFMRKEIKMNELIIFLCGIGIGYIIFKVLKEGHFVYIGGMNELTSVNIDLSYLDLIQARVAELGKYIIGCVCELYYFIVVGSIIFLCWLIDLIRQLKDSVYQKKINAIVLFQLLMVISNLFAFAPSLPNQVTRYDHTVYARYIENIMGPILLSGLWGFINQKEKLKIRMPIYFAMMECIMLFIYQVMKSATSHMFAIDSSVGIGALIGFWPTYREIFKGLCKSFFFSSLIILVYSLSYNRKLFLKKINLHVLMIIMVFVYWSYIGINANICNYNERNQIKNIYYDLVEAIEKLNNKQIIYIRDSEIQPTCLDGKYLQWALGNDYLFNVINYNEITNKVIQEDAVYVTSKGANVEQFMELGGIKYYENSKMEVYIIEN